MFGDTDKHDLTSLLVGQSLSGEAYPWIVGRTDHVIASTTLTAVRHRNEILRRSVLTLVHWPLGSFWCRTVYTAASCGLSEFLDDKGFHDIDWSSHSPVSNPIGHIRDYMYWCIQRHQVSPRTVQELTHALIQIWDEVPTDIICRLMSMLNILSNLIFSRV